MKGSEKEYLKWKLDACLSIYGLQVFVYLFVLNSFVCLMTTRSSLGSHPNAILTKHFSMAPARAQSMKHRSLSESTYYIKLRINFSFKYRALLEFSAKICNFYVKKVKS